MNEASNWLVHDHHKYDTALDACELEAGAGEWKNATRLFNDFIDDLRLHMRLEEEILYPFFVAEVEGSDEAIAVLTEEHEDLARLMKDMVYVVKTRDFDHFLDSLIPLHQIMNEHNRHEETVFKRIADHSLLIHRDEIMEQMKSLHKKDDLRTWEF